MKPEHRQAFDALTKAGIKCYDPVEDRPSWGNGVFDISGEEGDARVDYWGDSSMPEVQEMLAKHGLYAEWCNPGVVAVYDI